jgi:hypothetical protein
MSLDIALYQYPSDLRDLMEMREEAESRLRLLSGTIDDPPEEADEIQAAQDELAEIDKALKLYYEALPQKVDDVARAAKWLESLVGKSGEKGAIDREIEALKRRKATFEARLTSIKTMIQFVMEAMPWKPGKSRRLDGAGSTILLKQNGGKPGVEIYNEELVPDELCNVTVTLPADVWKNQSIALAQWPGLRQFEAPRVPSLSRIAEALSKRCGKCVGGKCVNVENNIVDCQDCGGTGRATVPGARFKPQGAHVEIK